ncbi:hypothetical protein [Halalkalibacter krulwichiae]|uniref:NERD domain-containing protein n=1 Tax=Halalkalibacter krulwichiae TaxID=199441 RepID=A0A1X9MH00_9BACI|nr:hypothetical protein [Halalkalibacter krulwichiae]ARK31770.1 hypothetical protein BkAM31D_19075 [Halalkalibacter krulwichiae]
MAHLIKLEDYISRYQFDLNRYPSQFTRMKKERWFYLKSEWKQVQFDAIQKEDSLNIDNNAPKKKGLLTRLKHWRKREKVIEAVDVFEDPFLSNTLEKVKEEYLDELFHSQLRWASSSLVGESLLDPKYETDEWLRFFAQEIPDNYFLMYKPVFFVKKAPVELDIILISPTEVNCITILKGQEHSVFEASSDRFWLEYIDKTRKKRISPLVSLSRMSGIIKPILDEEGVVFPVKRIVLSSKSIIDNKMQGARIELIDKRNFQEWTNKLKKHPSPIKSKQMKVTSLLLQSCFTDSGEKVEEE